MKTTKFECSCNDCQTACQTRPGWFLPEQIQPLADRLGITAKELFDTKLSIDWWVGAEPIFTLSPTHSGANAGEEVSYNNSGVCVFFKDGLCEIHDKGKPFECAALNHNTQKPPRKMITAKWKKEQQLITDLLGRKPVEDKGSLGDLLSMFLTP